MPTVHYCNVCEFTYPIESLERNPVGDEGAEEIGFWCPKCQTWTHCFFDTPKLAQQRALLNKFKAKAGDSAKAWGRWLRKKKQYQAAFDRAQAALRHSQGRQGSRQTVG